jgi:hypothetical protein
MRPLVIAALLTASILTTFQPSGALAQSVATQPLLPQSSVVVTAPPLDLSVLPPLPPIIPASERNRLVLLSTGAGAAFGVILVDLVTGGLLLAPLGVPGAAALFTAGGGAAATAAAAAVAPVYSIAQRVLAGVATMAAAGGGGYFGAYVARSRPDFIRIGD